MRYICIILTMFSLVPCFAQIPDDRSVPITPKVAANIRAEVERKIPAYRTHLNGQNLLPYEIEFVIDTFKVEEFERRWLSLNNNYSSIEDASFEAAKQYDVLLNKYYKKLLAALPDNARPLLIKTQRSWLVYRNNEYDMAKTISHIKFQGGTMQGLDNAAVYLNLIKDRVLALYGEYNDLFVNKE